MMRRATRRSLTVRGRSLLAGGLATVASAVVLDERDLLGLGMVAVLLPAVGLLLVLRRRSTAVVTRRWHPPTLRPGTTGRIRLTATTGRNRLAAGRLTEGPVAGLTAGMTGSLPALGRGRRVVVDYPLHATRRGRFSLGPATLTTGDPFGLWTQTTRLAGVTDLFVLPLTVPLIGLPAAAGAPRGTLTVTRAGTGTGDPDVAVRPYLPGDDIRTIAWAPSARRGEPLVRTREPATHGAATIILDDRLTAHHGGPDDSSLELAITVAASLAEHLIAADRTVRVVDHAGHPLTDGNSGADLLAAMARIEPMPATAPATTRRMRLRPAPHRCGGLVIAVLGDVDDDDLVALAGAKSAAGHAIAVFVDTARFDRRGRTDTSDGPAPVSPRSSAALTDWQTLTVGSASELASRWRQAAAPATAHQAAP